MSNEHRHCNSHRQRLSNRNQSGPQNTHFLGQSDVLHGITTKLVHPEVDGRVVNITYLPVWLGVIIQLVK